MLTKYTIVYRIAYCTIIAELGRRTEVFQERTGHSHALKLAGRTQGHAGRAATVASVVLSAWPRHAHTWLRSWPVLNDCRRALGIGGRIRTN